MGASDIPGKRSGCGVVLWSVSTFPGWPTPEVDGAGDTIPGSRQLISPQWEETKAGSGHSNIWR